MWLLHGQITGVPAQHNAQLQVMKNGYAESLRASQYMPLYIVCSLLYTDDYNYGLQMFIMQFKHLVHCVPEHNTEINSV